MTDTVSTPPASPAEPQFMTYDWFEKYGRRIESDDDAVDGELIATIDATDSKTGKVVASISYAIPESMMAGGNIGQVAKDAIAAGGKVDVTYGDNTVATYKKDPVVAGIDTAIHHAVSAIYFADTSDYRAALWAVVEALDPELAKLLERDPQGAWAQAAARVGIEQ